MVNAECPGCGAEVRIFTKPKMGQRVRCNSCQSDLEISWLEPVELDWAMDGYDEEDDDDLHDYEEDD
jgi:lysine biosynthesis protein LysW